MKYAQFFWTHESMDVTVFEFRAFRDSLDINEQIFEFVALEFCFGTHENLVMGNYESTKV